MNKVMTIALIAGGLMLLNSPEAAAHKEVRSTYQPQAYHHTYSRIDVRRPKHMPRWLKRNQAFRHWYKRTKVKRDRRLAWHELFEIYRWERRFGRSYYRSGNYWNDYYAYRYGERHDDRDRRNKRRHKH
jgi:hypothetical protein